MSHAAPGAGHGFNAKPVRVSPCERSHDRDHVWYGDLKPCREGVAVYDWCCACGIPRPREEMA